MVNVYAHLLARRYGNTLDSTAHQYIEFVTFGSRRMLNLVRDLLSYSRVSAEPDMSLSTFFFDEAVEEAKEQCRAAVDESDAAVTCAALPQITATNNRSSKCFRISSPMRSHTGERV